MYSFTSETWKTICLAHTRNLKVKPIGIQIIPHFILPIQNQDIFIRRALGIELFITRFIEFCIQFLTPVLLMIPILAGIKREHTRQLSGWKVLREL